MKRILSFKHTETQTDRLKHHKTSNVTSTKWKYNSLVIKIAIVLITGSTKFILSQSDFSVKVKGQTNRHVDGRKKWHRQKHTQYLHPLQREVGKKWNIKMITSPARSRTDSNALCNESNTKCCIMGKHQWWELWYFKLLLSGNSNTILLVV